MREQLTKILADHKVWVDSDEQSGKRADLNGADLSYADLSYANLRCAYLSGANLSRSDLHGADLTGADLNGAHLNGAHLNGADLSGADLHYADLTGAHFELEFKSVNNFSNTIFSKAAIPWVILNPQWSKWADTVTFV